MSTETPAAEEMLSKLWSHTLSSFAQQEPITATYRLQLNAAFTFHDAARIVPYLANLGISHVYCSPYLKARAGSMHGYDIVDHNEFNPELGGAEGFTVFREALRSNGMRHILDFVPNHMGVSGNDNRLWMDVLENGPGSRYARFFDIDWNPRKPDLTNKVLLPVLGDQFGTVLESGQLTLRYDGGTFSLSYFEHRFPISARTIAPILELGLEALGAALGSDDENFLELQSIVTAVKKLPPATDTEPGTVAELYREKEVIRRRLQELTEKAAPIRAFVEKNVTVFNGRPGEEASFDSLDALLDQQSYRLSYWRVATDEINYRRFFDINDLAALRMEDEAVFDEAHRLVFDLIARGDLDGLRIDHADGLYDPTAYLRALQRRRFLQLLPESARRMGLLGETEPSAGTEIAGTTWESAVEELSRRFDEYLRDTAAGRISLPLYVVVEKILEHSEALPETWPVEGTTGYDFLASVNELFVEEENAAVFDKIYARLVQEMKSYDELVYEGKKLITIASMSSEIAMLGYRLDRLSEQERRSRDFTLNSLTYALREIIACFPVYRTYIAADEVLERDRKYITLAVARAKYRNPQFDPSLFDFVRSVLMLENTESKSEELKRDYRELVGRFQQTTGPVTAKGVEDTTFYRYHRLISLNEVGSNPKVFGVPPDDFHRENVERAKLYPQALNATSTHDTKRGEDARARLNVLSELPKEWKDRVLHWAKLNKRKRVVVDGASIPSLNDEYFLYQTLVATWPFAFEQDRVSYIERIQQYALKAAREAKQYTSWLSPVVPYEEGIQKFVANILAQDESNHFVEEVDTFVKRIAEPAIWTSLSQLVLKALCPGVPDIYQGTEYWDLTLVDPDNRRPVDYDRRSAQLNSIVEEIGSGQPLDALRRAIEQRHDGTLKLHALAVLLRIRKRFKELAAGGDYLPIAARGQKSRHLIAFTRRHGSQCLLVVVPRLIMTLCGEQMPIGENVWADTAFDLPDFLHGTKMQNVFTTAELAPRSELKVAEALSAFPVGVFAAEL